MGYINHRASLEKAFLFLGRTLCLEHFKPLPMMTAYKNLGFDISDYPNAYHQYENEITLPLHTKLSDEDVDYIISGIREIMAD